MAEFLNIEVASRDLRRYKELESEWLGLHSLGFMHTTEAGPVTINSSVIGISPPFRMFLSLRRLTFKDRA